MERNIRSRVCLPSCISPSDRIDVSMPFRVIWIRSASEFAVFILTSVTVEPCDLLRESFSKIIRELDGRDFRGQGVQTLLDHKRQVRNAIRLHNVTGSLGRVWKWVVPSEQLC